MNKKLLALTISLAFSAASGFVHAQGNISAGKTLAASCASCHGEDGNSMMPTFPKLAGQHASYLAQQLYAFKENLRNAPMMAPLAMGLNDEAINDLAAYFADQKITANELPAMDIDDDDEDDEENPEKTAEEKTAELDELMVLGSNLYRNGNLKTKVSACMACHGPVAEGNKLAKFPSLRSQHADYLIKSLSDYKKGSRSNQTDNMMHMIAQKMTEKEIKAVAYHISMKK